MYDEPHKPEEESEHTALLAGVLNHVARRRAAGEVVHDAEVIAAHPELMPELGEQLAALRRVEEARANAGDGLAGRPTPMHPAAALIGRKIGRYTIRRLIATGGMGSVYEAMQESPTRSVALKLMRGGIASRSALRRFEFEAQLLGRLHHPGIAQVYEAGTHDDAEGIMDVVAGPAGSYWTAAATDSRSIPYFAMEYIPRAMPLTDYATARKLTTTQRLELFARICDAVHYGHQEGIIHRDLKPSNILVDSSGHPKVIDFGVARATDSDMAITTMQTDVRHLIGTLQYMSPEQCNANPSGLDIRSDVYALGVVLYELLLGKLPYDLSDLGIYDATVIIRERLPGRPSTIDYTVRGDVEAIVLKALEKDRSKRYQSAAELAADIRRYLAHQPISPRRSGIARQAGAFARRNKALTGGVVVLFVALVMGLAGTVRQVMPAQRRACLARPPGLVSWWTGDTDASDGAGSNDGRLVGGASAGTEGGLCGGAFRLDGVDDYIRIDGNATLNASSFTIQGWFLQEGPGPYSLFEFHTGGRAPEDFGPHVFSQAYGPLMANVVASTHSVGQSDSYRILSTRPGLVSLKKWHHYALTYDAETGQGVLYLDGATVAAETWEPFTPRTDLDVYIGHRPHEGYFDGLIDEVMYFDHPLAASEIAGIVAAGSAGVCKPPPSQRQTCVPRPPGLVSWIPGDSTLDIQRRVSGVSYGDVSFSSGIVGNALAFNESVPCTCGGPQVPRETCACAYVEVPDDPALRITETVTIEFWAKRTQLDRDSVVLEKGGDLRHGRMNYGAALQGAIYENRFLFRFAGGGRTVDGPTDLNWHHYAVVATHGEADPVMYVDGVARPITVNHGEAAINLFPSIGPLHIGAQVDSPQDTETTFNRWGDAMIDELSIYDRGLSASEIRAIFDAGSAGKCSPVCGDGIIDTALGELCDSGNVGGLSCSAVGMETGDLACGDDCKSLDASGCSSPCASAPSGLLHWWPGDGNTDNLASDNKAVLGDMAGYDTGMVGDAFTLFGEPGQVASSEAVGITGNAPRTVCAWVRSAHRYEATCCPTPFSFGQLGVGEGFGIFACRGAWWVWTGEQTTLRSDRTADTGWHHHCVVYDSRAMSYYIDGILAGSDEKHLRTGSSRLIMGFGFVPEKTPAFEGLVDEMQIFDRALSPTEIRAIVAAGSGGICKPGPQ